MHRRISLQDKAISYPVILFLVICFNHCLAQHYEYSDYSYRNARDYQYEDDYNEDYDKSGSSGGGGGGGLSPLAALIAPLAALALLGAASLISLSPTLLQIAVIQGKRRRRRRRKRWADHEEEGHEYQGTEDKLYDEMELFENFFAKQPQETIRNQTQELFANYIQCSGLSSGVDTKNNINQCLEHLVCLYANPHATVPFTNQPVEKAEKDVISIILFNLLSNNFIDEHTKSRVRVAARQSRSVLESSSEHQAAAWCSVYKCHLIEEQFIKQSSLKPSHQSHRYYYM